MSVLMIDGTTGDVPVILQRFGPQTPVAGYVTGQGIEWTEGQFASFARKIRIAQSFDLAVDEASDARVLDVESGAATPEDWPAFFASRTDKPRATCYCSLDTVPAVLNACDAAEIERPQRLWLAWYVFRIPTVDEILSELHRLTGVILPASHVWGVQHSNFAYWDESAVYGTPDFSRR